MIDTQGLTQKQKQAAIKLHGSPKTPGEARIDRRTINSLVRRGILQSNGRTYPQYTLTPEAVAAYNAGAFDEAFG